MSHFTDPEGPKVSYRTRVGGTASADTAALDDPSFFHGDDDFVRPTHYAVGRIGGSLAVALAAAVSPGIGPHRWWLVAALIVLHMPSNLAILKWVSPAETASVQATVDAVGCVLLVNFIPQHWTTALVIGVATITSNAGALGARRFAELQAFLAIGMGAVGALHGVEGMLLPIIAISVVTPSIAVYTDWLQSRDALFASRLQDMVRSVAAILWEADPVTGEVLQVMGPTDEVTGHDAATFAATYPDELVHPDDLELKRQPLPDDGTRVERSIRLRHRNGQWIWLREVTGLVDAVDGRRRVRGVAFDITDLQEARQELAVRADYDSLTGLLGREAVHRHIAQRTSTESGAVGVLLMDLDGFKNINDTMGHPVGDRLLKIQAERLTAAARDSDVVGRLGGDEFVVVTPLSHADGLLRFARRLVAVLAQPIVIDGVEMVCGASIGIATAPNHGRTVDELVRHADYAMYQAKRARIGVRVYEPRNDDGSLQRLEWLAELTQNLESQMEMWFQPIVDTVSGERVALEGLARWQHPVDGLVMPNDFIELIESAGLTVRFDATMLDRAISRLGELGPASSLTISVNVTQQTIADLSLARRLERRLDDHGVLPDRLVIEISERDVSKDHGSVVKTLTALRELGVGISLDDFGTGYSSLSRVRELPLTEIKIDRRFVSVMTANPADAIIVRSTVEMAGELGLSVVAEGVADEATRTRLHELGCARLQGFLFAEATPEGELAGPVRPIVAAESLTLG